MWVSEAWPVVPCYLTENERVGANEGEKAARGL